MHAGIREKNAKGAVRAKSDWLLYDRRPKREIRVRLSQDELAQFEAWRREAGFSRPNAIRLALKLISQNKKLKATHQDRGGWKKGRPRRPTQDNTPHQPENGGNTN